MISADPLVPAAPHLVGPDGRALLDAAVVAAGGVIDSAEVAQVQYRPGVDMVARYDAVVSWQGGPPRAETLLAGVTSEGAFPGTLPLEAGDLVAGVWRYPFDPRLPGLARAVTPGELARLVSPWIDEVSGIEVRAYRPIRRAVVQVTGADGQEVYVKVVRPHHAARILARHHDLAAAGVPVPGVLHADLEAGLLVLAALTGRNLRDELLDPDARWPDPAQHRHLLEHIASAVCTDPAAPPDLTHAARSHAAAIAAVLPGVEPLLREVLDLIGDLRPATGSDAVTIHGDFYEAQLVVRGARITGVLDLDDVGRGHPLDDAATLLAHLQILPGANRSHRARLSHHRRRLRSALGRGHDLRELDRRTAAVLVGLATGPFRAQSTAWQREVRRRLSMAQRLLTRPAED